MALTEEQITAKNFKDFYSQIRPYLNGQVPPVFNKFSKSDLYSTEERIVGQWIDGRPVYQQTVESISGTKSADKLLISNPDIDHLIHADGYCIRANGRIDMFPGMSASVSIHDGGIYTCPAADSLTNRPICIIIQYTKTTDDPVEIGNDTDYSTTEKIVGTWIDGKPVYQKTYQLSNMECGAGSYTTVISSSQDAGIANIKDIFSSVVGGSPMCTYPERCKTNSGNLQLMFKTSTGLATTNYLTITYTKTTD